ncbi:MAG TPA: hypothetical protein VHW01_17600, partial [Polyangiaceae bacterium]|nr:hypothetical protein [Polyangiaceae bacterium]
MPRECKPMERSSPTGLQLLCVGSLLALLGSCVAGCSLSAPSYGEFASGTSAGAGGLPVSAGGAPDSSGGMLDLGGAASALGGGGGDAGPDGDAASANGDAGSPDVGGAASGGAGGAGGTAGSGGNAGSGGSGCTSAGTELCDNFEGGVIDKALWQTPKPSTGVTVAVDNSRPHAGKYSLHIHGPAGGHNAGVIAEAVTFPARSNSFYARIFAYLYPDLPQTQGSNYQMGFIYGTGKNNDGNVQTGMGIIGGSNQIVGYSIFYGPPFFQFGPWSPTRITPGTWICLELHEDGSNVNTEDRQVWINDQELTELRSDSKTSAGSSNANHLSPTYTLVNVGLSEFTGTPALTDMWVDDVRIS